MRMRWAASSALALLFSLNACREGETARVTKPETAQPPIQTQPAVPDTGAQQSAIKWRDVFHIDISDPELRRHVEGFLTYLETADYSGVNEAMPELNEGQWLLFGLKRVQDHYRTEPTIVPDREKGARIDEAKKMAQHFQELGLMHDGKFIITAHDTPYDSQNNENGPVVSGYKFKNFWPGRISLGTDYLKGARYRDERGGLQSVSVDAVLVNQFAHFIWMIDDPSRGLEIENDYLRAMGAPERVDLRIEYRRDANSGYRTLYDQKGSPLLVAQLVQER